ncbi:DNA-deoxyinosine glycosylase [Mycobacterium eburneum]|nr:DNA-deoxyinosine glycosylase [Mycobacterium eburneum]TDH51714.1 DNA-deoxyinosine glycosylase [Mycobacterium eburneum]
MATPLLEGFPPVVDDRARRLILGSFPSVQSLATRQYYGNPRNAFWRITGALWDFDPAAPYDTRLAALRSHGVALWDVLRACRRVGSADAKIDPNSMVANDFAVLFARYPGIERVYFNGSAAAQIFRRRVEMARPLPCVQLPSTSPARAMALADKLDAWRLLSAG